MAKTSIITGGGRGIGYAISEQLGRDGFNIVIFDLSDKNICKKALDSLKSQGIDILYIQGSIVSSEDRENCVKQAIERFGSVEVLVNNAGVSPIIRADIMEMTEESFDRVVGINTKGTLFMTQVVVKQMLNQNYNGNRRGTIINISSSSARISSTSRGEYCISKAGVSMLTKLYADRLAADGIPVFEIRPGVIRTDMTKTVMEKYDCLISNSDKFLIQRWGEPKDVANAVSAFCSDKFSYTTGNYIDIDGGLHIQRL